MIDPAKPAPEAPGARLTPMVLKVHAVAKVSVKNVAEGEIALERLDQIGLYAAAQPVEQVAERRHELINDKEERQGAGWRRHADEPDFFRTGIFELYGEDGKVVLRCECAQHGQMAAASGIIARYFVVVDCDVQGRASSSETLHLAGARGGPCLTCCLFDKHAETGHTLISPVGVENWRNERTWEIGCRAENAGSGHLLHAVPLKTTYASTACGSLRENHIDGVGEN
jgi:hypothetical protein